MVLPEGYPYHEVEDSSEELMAASDDSEGEENKSKHKYEDGGEGEDEDEGEDGDEGMALALSALSASQTGADVVSSAYAKVCSL